MRSATTGAAAPTAPRALNLHGAVAAHRNHGRTNNRRHVLLQYACEWCHRIKKSGDRWILGFAAEKVGATSARREVTIVAEWSERWAGHPLAVHFCSEKHKEQFVHALFDAAPPARPQSRRRTATAVRKGDTPTASVGGALLQAANGEPARTRSTASRSRRRQRASRRAAAFSAPDDVRAHGLSVRLDEPTRVVHASREDAEATCTVARRG